MVGLKRARTGQIQALAAAAVLAMGLVVIIHPAGAAGAPPLGVPAVRQVAGAPNVWDSSDPGVLVANGRTFLFGSSNNMRLPVREITTFAGTLDQSRDAWGGAARNALSRLPAWINPSDAQIWAPSPVRIGSRYFVYFAAHRRGASDRQNDQCIGRAVATRAMGPYSPEAAPLYCGLPPERGSNPWGRGALDPEVFRAPGGALYLLVAVARTRDNIGVLRLSSDGKVIGGSNARPTTLVSQRFGWHDGTDDASLGPTFLENPSMLYDTSTRTYLLFYSAGQWWTSRYVTGFARCAGPLGPCTLDNRGPFLRSGASRTGPGGLTAFRDADGVARVAYASWRRGAENVPSSDGSTSRHTTLARLILTGSNPATQTIGLRPR